MWPLSPGSPSLPATGTAFPLWLKTDRVWCRRLLDGPAGSGSALPGSAGPLHDRGAGIAGLTRAACGAGVPSRRLGRRTVFDVFAAPLSSGWLGWGWLADRAPAWQRDAACIEHPNIDWFAESPAQVARAKAVCETCLVRDECLSFALDLDETNGVWGGLEPRERRRLARGRRPSATTVATDERDDRIRRERAAGVTYADLGRRYGISPERVRQIVAAAPNRSR